MTKPQHHEIIEGVPCLVTDLGCDDLERAALNRALVESGVWSSAYEEIRRALSGVAQGAPLPRGVPRGSLPEITREDWVRNFGGEYSSLHEDEAVQFVVATQTDLE